jgi:hypothetical protein
MRARSERFNPLHTLAVAAVTLGMLAAAPAAFAQPDKPSSGGGGIDPDYADSVLNRQVAEQNNDAARTENEDDDTYEARLRERQRIINAQNAAAAQARADYERRMAQWRADVRACEDGDRSRCARD